MIRSKFILIVILIVTNFNIKAQDSSNVKLDSRLLKILSMAQSRIYRIDTIFNDSTGLEKIIGYDKNDSIVKITSHYIYSSLGIMGPHIDVFNLKGQLILEQTSNYKGVIWHQYFYEYDIYDRLIKKEGFSLGELEYKIEYIYKKGKLVRENEYRNGNLIESKIIR